VVKIEMPAEIIAARIDEQRPNDSQDQRREIARHWLMEVKEDMLQPLCTVVENCIEGHIVHRESGLDWNEPAFKKAICELAVRPLGEHFGELERAA
jgi:hypothetical protein